MGGDLTGALLAYRLKKARPYKKVVLIEQNNQIGQNRHWCFHGCELPNTQIGWLRPLLSQTWNLVRINFPDLQKTLRGSFHHLSAATLDKTLRSLLKEDLLTGQKAEEISSSHVITQCGVTWESPLVLNTVAPKINTHQGYLESGMLCLRLKASHHLPFPIAYDAVCPQLEGFRYLSVVPLGGRELFIKDTRFMKKPPDQTASMKSDILSYLYNLNWKTDEILSFSQTVSPLPTKVLPSQIMPLGHNDPAPVGMAANFFNYALGNSLAASIEIADMIGQSGRWSSSLAKASLKKFEETFVPRQSFNSYVNKLVLQETQPEESYQIWENFFKLPPETLDNFYAGRLSVMEKLKIVTAKSPVPLYRRLLHYWGS